LEAADGRGHNRSRDTMMTMNDMNEQERDDEEEVTQRHDSVLWNTLRIMLLLLLNLTGVVIAIDLLLVVLKF